MAPICNSTADPSSACSNAGTVPNHAILRALPGGTNKVTIPSVLIEAFLHRITLGFTGPALTCAMAGANHHLSQVSTFPLLVYLVIFPIVIARILGIHCDGGVCHFDAAGYQETGEQHGAMHLLCTVVPRSAHSNAPTPLETLYASRTVGQNREEMLRSPILFSLYLVSESPCTLR